MGTRGTHAKDGTPRCADPKQDSAGNWSCPSCGKSEGFKSEGFKSKHAVLGHLRFCRPGNPANKEPMVTSGAASVSDSFAIIRSTLWALKVSPKAAAMMADRAIAAMAAVESSLAPDAGPVAELIRERDKLRAKLNDSVLGQAEDLLKTWQRLASSKEFGHE